jgi:uncharacterized membrane protein (DUF441 family)
MQAYLFLFLLLGISLIAKNQSLLIASGLLIALKAIGLDAKWFDVTQKNGINWGVAVITIAVLVPIATGAIGFKDLGAALKSPYAWIALTAGILVALIAKNGVVLLAEDPHITAALVFGTILSVAFFNGVAVGPLVGAGIAYYAMKLFSSF